VTTLTHRSFLSLPCVLRDRCEGEPPSRVPNLGSPPSAGETRGAQRRSREGATAQWSQPCSAVHTHRLGGSSASLIPERSLASPSLTLASLGPSLPRGERIEDLGTRVSGAFSSSSLQSEYAFRSLCAFLRSSLQGGVRACEPSRQGPSTAHGSIHGSPSILAGARLVSPLKGGLSDGLSVTQRCSVEGTSQ